MLEPLRESGLSAGIGDRASIRARRPAISATSRLMRSAIANALVASIDGDARRRVRQRVSHR